MDSKLSRIIAASWQHTMMSWGERRSNSMGLHYARDAHLNVHGDFIQLIWKSVTQRPRLITWSYLSAEVRLERQCICRDYVKSTWLNNTSVMFGIIYCCITNPSHGLHGTSNHRQRDCFFNNFFRQRHIKGGLYWPFVKRIHRKPVASLAKGQ